MPVRYHELIRWRLNDPAEEDVVRWTRVHRVSFIHPGKTLCRLRIPDLPFDLNRNDEIPVEAPRCKTCLRGERE